MKIYHTFFSTLATPLRIDILSTLMSGEKNVTEVCSKLGVEQSKMSHALSGLRRCNMVKARKDGKARVYSINRDISQILLLIEQHERKSCKLCRCLGKK